MMARQWLNDGLTMAQCAIIELNGLTAIGWTTAEQLDDSSKAQRLNNSTTQQLG
jgi:hypothetical protein